jgi:hypothetical protein
MTALTEISLDRWADHHQPDESLYFSDGFWNQVQFALRHLPAALGCQREQVSVISSHFSKSVELPVYRIRAHGMALTLRNNFHDWKVSVDSDAEVVGDFSGLFDSKRKVLPVYCEGFAETDVHGPFSDDRRRFTVEIADNFRLYTFLYLLRR